ncbi:tetratricopeptide repeat protein [Stenotrophomonas mori]|uniref:Sel1 repeat family protein n=1 Tax=Stenotrophomonas mori TaxID=2871096 RepID=A0ABT0SI21_9GAMM|nr:hypothetical protein [Stenotrophomonas mori]MCL7714963.1 hypothetical protein [Stenotrophomonas mori]
MEATFEEDVATQAFRVGVEGGFAVALCRQVRVLVIALMAGGAFPALAQSPVEEPLLELQCNQALYPFLPGELNYCLGLKMWARKHYRQGERLFRLAAGWGSKPAQYALGIAYFNGEGLAVDRLLGAAWLRLAAERRDPAFQIAAETVHAALSTEERRRAEALFDALWPRYRDDVAALRALRRFKREVATVAGNAAYRPAVCVAGLRSNAGHGSPESSDECPSAERAVIALEAMSVAYFKGWKGGWGSGRWSRSPNRHRPCKACRNRRLATADDVPRLPGRWVITDHRWCGRPAGASRRRCPCSPSGTCTGFRARRGGPGTPTPGLSGRASRCGSRGRRAGRSRPATC